MIPPRGFKSELYPLRHRLIFSAALSPSTDAINTVYLPIVMGSSEMDQAATAVKVNPHNSDYVEDAGPLCRQMSIIDKIRISLKFNLTELTHNLAHTSGQSTGSEVFSGDGIQALHFLWRPIFGSFTEKLDSTDDDTTITAAAVLGLTHDATFEDVVPITTNKLSVIGASDLSLPVSTVNAVQVFGDFNMTTDLTMEDHVHDEDQLQAALRRFTNKGAIRSMIGRTRHVTLTRNRPYKNFYMDKFLPRSVRRIMPFSFFGIQVHVPIQAAVEQVYHHTAIAGTGIMGVKCIVNYHEWHPDHDQDLGTPG